MDVFEGRAGVVVSLCGAAMLSLLSGCTSGGDCATPPDAQGVVDADGAADAPPVTAECRRDKVECGDGEINAFGICLAQSTMVKVAAGKFAMGKNEEGQPYSPAHEVTLKEYLIDRTEVPVAQYKACVDCGVCKRPLRDGSNTGREPYYGDAKYDDHPVIYVSWKDAKAYCEAIGKRLPSEAEWEKAARGNQGAEYPWGSASPTPSNANYSGMTNDTGPVGEYAAGKSPSGALNMAGNVWEWVNDSYDPSYYASSPTADPPGPKPTPIKVARGGGFNSSSAMVTTYARAGFGETAAFSFLGFRCAMDR